MSLLLHPGFILLLVGILAALVPTSLRKPVLAGGPILALISMIMLPNDVTVHMPFIMDLTLTPVAVDKLSWVFGLIFSMMAAIGGIYSAHNKSRVEAISSMFYAGSALFITLAGDWVTFVFFWELLAVASVFLILAKKTDASRRAAFRYFLVHMFGGNMVLVGVLIKLSQGELLISNLAGVHDTAFWLLLIGVAINAAIPPLNGWLPDAYPEGTITGSVFLSSFTTKVAVYALIRIFAGVEMLAWAGAIMAIFGVVYAVIENDMRRLLSYHIISQVGFMVCGVGIGTAMALDGATAHAFSHILYKSLLFMATGAIIYSTGLRKISDLGGLAKKMPFVFAVFTIAAFSISGVPLFNGFISKSITMSAAIENHNMALYFMMLLASVGTFLSITLKMIYFIFFGEDKNIEIKRELPKNMLVAMGIGAALCTIYGIYPDLLYRFLPYGTEYAPYTVDHLTQYIELLVATAIPFIIFLKRMKPHDGLTLDLDWLYRKPLMLVVNMLSYIACAVRTSLGRFFREFYEAFLRFSANPLALISVSYGDEADDTYDPDRVRSEIGESALVLFIMLAVIIVTVLVLM